MTVDVTVSPLPKVAPISGIFKVPYVRIQMSHFQEGFPDYTSPPTLHGSLTWLYTPLEQQWLYFKFLFKFLSPDWFCELVHHPVILSFCVSVRVTMQNSVCWSEHGAFLWPCVWLCVTFVMLSVRMCYDRKWLTGGEWSRTVVWYCVRQTVRIILMDVGLCEEFCPVVSD